MIASVVALYARLFAGLDHVTRDWLPGALARLVFAGVLAGYYLNSALTKFDGSPFTLSAGAYVQIIPPVFEAAGYDASQIAFFPWGLIVYLGSYTEVILPILIVLGLFTRLAALGMIGFVVVQSYVDIAFHHVDAATIGAWFNAQSGSAILDQRSLWIFLLAILVLQGAGRLSLDYLFGRSYARAR